MSYSAEKSLAPVSDRTPMARRSHAAVKRDGACLFFMFIGVCLPEVAAAFFNIGRGSKDVALNLGTDHAPHRIICCHFGKLQELLRLTLRYR